MPLLLRGFAESQCASEKTKSNNQPLVETNAGRTACTICELHLRLYRHMVGFSEVHLAH